MKKTYQLIIIAVILLLIILLPSIVKADTLTWKDESQGIEWQYELDKSGNVVNLECNTNAISGKVEIPSTIDGKNVISLKAEIFKNKKGITEVVIPNTLERIEYSAFEGCSGIKKINIPGNVIQIGNFAFEDCTGLSEVTLNQGTTNIGTGIFMNCSGIKKIVIPEGVTEIPYEMFVNCSGLTEIELSKTVTTIGGSAFWGCSSLKELKLNDNVTSIGEYAFSGCYKLEKILIPDSVVSIPYNNFKNSSNLTIYGNDGMKSKEFAEENNIKFDYIANWDKKDTGDDVTAPAVEEIEISEDSIKNCTRDTNTKSYIAPANTKIIINVKFNENLVGNTMPSLVIKFGDSKEIELTNGVLGGSTISYSYTIKDEDKGTISAVNLKGGDLKDAVGNVAVLSCPNINIQYSEYSLYANGSLSENVPDNKDDQKQDDTNKDNTNKDNTNKDNTSKNDTNKDNNQNNEKKDNTTATGNIPQTGMNYTVISIIALIAIISIVSYKKYTNYKDVK